MSTLARWTGAALDLLLPSLCPLCRIAAGPTLCAECRDRLPRIDDPCPWCGAAGATQGNCRVCAGRGLRGIARVHVAFHYHGAVERLVGNAKAAGRPAAVQACADLLHAIPGRGLVTSIPETPGRRPGPHLATALARAVARRNALPFQRVLRQTRRPRIQHALTAAERARNVAGIFTSRPVPDLVILVDDLLTSGATAISAAAALRAAGARRVELVCLARTPRDEEVNALINHDPSTTGAEPIRNRQPEKTTLS